MAIKVKIPLIKPVITSEAIEEVVKILQSGYLTEGPATAEFEKSIASYTGTEHCIAVTSCTVGLEAALRAAGIGQDDEVIVPDYTYPATASAVCIVGATPVIVDVCRDTMLIDYDELEKNITQKTKAVIPVSLFGNPLDWDRLQEIRDKHQILIIEDAACALGSEYKGQKTGTFADATIFSHHPRKTITTGEGGTIVTNNSNWAKWLSSFKHFGMKENQTRHSTEFIRIGTNLKLSNVLAAIGLSQMSDVDVLISRRREIADKYLTALSNVREIRIPTTTFNGKHSYQSFCILIDARDKILSELHNEGIEAQIGTYSLHMHEAFSKHKTARFSENLKNSRKAFTQALVLPLFHEMTDAEITTVCEKLTACISRRSSTKRD